MNFQKSIVTTLCHLTAEHINHLKSEGFTIDHIQFMQSIGVKSLSEKAARDLNIGCAADSGQFESSSGIYFPFTSSFGQLRCDNPPFKSGKPAKYLTQAGQKSEAYLPIGCEVVTEGFKDAISGSLHGIIPTGALAGVSHYRGALPPKSGLTVLFDSDGWTNPQIFTQLFKAGLFLKGRIQLVPQILGEPKAGLCEYFKEGYTAEDYRSLINSAMEPHDFLVELPNHWLELNELDRAKCVKVLLRLAALYLNSSKVDQILEALNMKWRAASKHFKTASDTEVDRLTSLERECRLKAGDVWDLTGYLFWDFLRKNNPIYHDWLKLIAFGNRLRFNTLRKQIELDGELILVGSARSDLNISHGLKAATRTEFPDIVVRAAKRNSYSPIVEYLDSVSAKHGDDAAILNDLACRYFGQPATIYNSMIRRTLIAAVARAYEPGCKVDTALILQGAQGVGKSTFFKILSSAEYFDDSLGNIGEKDEKLKLHRCWFTEWGELETVFKRKDVAQIKAFLSSPVDFVRPPYGRDTEEMRRPSVIVGTTNQNEFLSDATGNRRFWIVPVTQQIDLELLRWERDRIWAAAVALYRRGESWWLSAQEEVESAAVAEDFQSNDPWFEQVSDFLSSVDTVKIPQILDALQIETARQGKAEQMRVADILKQLRWYKPKNPQRINGTLSRVWCKPEAQESTVSEAAPVGHPIPEVVPKPSQRPDDLPSWVRLGAIAIHGPTSDRFPVFKVTKSKKPDSYFLCDSAGRKYALSECREEISEGTKL